MYIFPTFKNAIGYAKDCLRVAPVTHSRYWQGVDISQMREAATAEHMHFSMKVPMVWDLEALRADVEPDLPWADDHHQERISGEPMNPTPSEDWWPHAPPGQKNDKFKRDYGDGVLRFSHTYPERMWPQGLRGQRWDYATMQDVANLLATDPLTRQAYLPIWWPEDGASPATERKPCTIGYQFIARPDQQQVPRLDIVYTIRSCDYIKHFRNDIYFAVRLAAWMREQAMIASTHNEDLASHQFWSSVQPGKLVMHITSLHMFYNDYLKTFGRAPGY